MPNPNSVALVVTTIQPPNDVLHALAEMARDQDLPFIVMGDAKSPADFRMEGVEYFSIEQQHGRFGRFSEQLPLNHYSRKNLGYLAALDSGCRWIVETDDDNYPLERFLEPPPDEFQVWRVSSPSPWINAYRYFIGPTETVWPRGFPLEYLAEDSADSAACEDATEASVIVQGLADDNPDVDAVFRLTRSLPVNFSHDAPAIALAAGNWCPFNSQNTWISRRAAALAYLPSHCSFRMTDIWRSLIAQRCLWAQGLHLIFMAPTVRQERNEHNLLRDFEDEIPGYLGNAAIARTLGRLALSGHFSDDLRHCYQALIEAAFFPPDELELVDAWLRAIERRMR